jgi:hypothetical protein
VEPVTYALMKPTGYGTGTILAIGSIADLELVKLPDEIIVQLSPAYIRLFNCATGSTGHTYSKYVSSNGTVSYFAEIVSTYGT